MYVRCVQKIALLIFPAPSFYVRTYMLWATAGTTGKKTVANLRSSRNTKVNPNDESNTTTASSIAQHKQ